MRTAVAAGGGHGAPGSSGLTEFRVLGEPSHDHHIGPEYMKVGLLKCGPYPYAKVTKAWASFETASIGCEREATLSWCVYLLVLA